MSKESGSVIQPVPLHNPGCDDPSKICSPHPPGLETIETAIQNTELLLFSLLTVGVAVGIAYAAGRYKDAE